MVGNFFFQAQWGFNELMVEAKMGGKEVSVYVSSEK